MIWMVCDLIWAKDYKVYTLEEHYEIISARHCSEKGVGKQSKIEDSGSWQIRAATTEHALDLKERSRDRAAAANCSKKLKKKANIGRLWQQKTRARNSENVLSNMTGQRKGKAKEIDQDAPLKETIPQKENISERQGEVHQVKKIVFSVYLKQRKL